MGPSQPSVATPADAQHRFPEWVTSSGLIMSRLGQVSLTKPTYRRIVLRCCSVPQAKPSPDYEYRISLRPHPADHPSSSTRDSASRAVQSSIRVRRDRYREAGEWQQAGGNQPDRAAQKVFARAGPENRAAISIRSARLSDAGAEFDSLGDLAGRGQQPSPLATSHQSCLARARVVPGVNILTTFLSNLLNLLKMKMIMIKECGTRVRARGLIINQA